MMRLSFPCRASKCRAILTVSVNVPYNTEQILREHDWTRSPDGVGFFCEDHRPGGPVVRGDIDPIHDDTLTRATAYERRHRKHRRRAK